MNHRITTFLLGLTLAAGCKNGGVVQSTADLWVIAPDNTNVATKMSADFGNVCVGVPKNITYTFEVSQTALLTISPGTNMSTSAGEFTITDPLPSAPAFNVPGTQTMTLAFNPTTTGARSGTLNFQGIDFADNMPLKIALTGTGANGAPEPLFDTSCPLPGASTGALPLTPCNSLTFQGVYFNSTQNIAVHLYNDGGCPPFVVDDVSVTYPNGLFSDGGGPFNPVGLTLPQSVALADQAYSLLMSYAPKCPVVGCTSTTDTAQLNIHTTNGFEGDAGTWTITLNGAGVAPNVTLAGPGGETGCNKFSRFGDIYAYEREPVTLTFSITNTTSSMGDGGNTSVIVGAAFLDAGDTGFQINHQACWATNSTSEVLPDGGIWLKAKNSSADCDVTFDVVNATNKYPKNGAFFDYLEVPYAAFVDGGRQDFSTSVCLRAVSEPKVCVSPSNRINLPPVTYCGFVPQDIQFSNCGSVDLTVNDIYLGTQTISSWTLFKGSAPPLTLQWSDPPITATVLYSDDGGTNNPTTTVNMSSNATAGTIDGGTTVFVNATATGLNPPPDLLIPAFSNPIIRAPLSDNNTYQVDMPPPPVTPYQMNWYYKVDGGIVDAGELVSDGGYHAWLHPTNYGVYNVCANVTELPLPDGGNCNASVDGGGNCTTPGFTIY